MARYRVGVAFGGRSTEHEVSVVTAMQVIRALSERHDVTPIYITKDGAWLTGKKLARMETYRGLTLRDPDLQSIVITPDTGLQALLNPLPSGLMGKPRKLELDLVFPVFHGAHGEDGAFQGLLELANLPYVGPGVLASAIGMDKLATKAVLRQAGLPVLDWMGFSRADWERDSEVVLADIGRRFAFPLIVKPSGLGSSIGVQRVDKAEDLAFAIDVAIHFDQRIMVEPCVADRTEVNCAVLGMDPLIASVCEQPVSSGPLLSYNDKYLHEGRERGMEGAARVIPAPIRPDQTEQVQAMAIAAFRAIGCAGTARIDFLLDQSTDTVYVNELNTIPGSMAFYLWEPSGIKPEALVDRLLDLAMQAHREKRKTTYSIATTLFQKADLLGMKK
jgi:D-alanine-D-alanine ligase